VSDRSGDFTLLECDIRHHLLLMADWLAATNQGGEPVSIGVTERVGLIELATRVEPYTEGAGVLRHVESFLAAKDSPDYVRATKVFEDLLHATQKFTPHCVQAQDPGLTPMPEGFGNGTVVRRLSVDTPASMVLLGANRLETGEYYSLSPYWSSRLGDRHRFQHERILHSELVKYLDTYQRGIAGEIGYAPNFRAWISQFLPDEILMATKLFCGLRYFDNTAIREAWIHVYQSLCERIDASSSVCVFGLGHGAKSGRLAPYAFRQAVSQLERGGSLNLRDPQVFRDLSAADSNPPDVAVFLDDILGTGKQSRGLLAAYLDRHVWLRSAKRYLCTVTGFASSAEDLRTSNPRLVDDLIIGVPLDDGTRAFSLNNPLWRTDAEAACVQRWASQLGSELLSTSTHGLNPESDAMGFGNSQAMVVFPYNIPNNTLPIFWARGVRSGRHWQALYERFD
jgi:hypothetical protein